MMMRPGRLTVLCGQASEFLPASVLHLLSGVNRLADLLNNRQMGFIE